MGMCGCLRAGPTQPNAIPRVSVAVLVLASLLPPLCFGREKEGLHSLQFHKGFSILTLSIIVSSLHKFHTQEKIVFWGVGKSWGHLIATIIYSEAPYFTFVITETESWLKYTTVLSMRKGFFLFLSKWIDETCWQGIRFSHFRKYSPHRSTDWVQILSFLLIGQESSPLRLSASSS